MHADEQTNVIFIFQGCKAPSRSGQGRAQSFSQPVLGGTCRGGSANSWSRQGGGIAVVAGPGGGDDGHATFCVGHEHRHGRRRGTQPRLSVSGARGGGHISYLTACTLPHFPWSTLACSCSALCKEHRGQWTPCRLRHIPQASAFISRSRASNERIRLHRCRILVG